MRAASRTYKVVIPARDFTEQTQARSFVSVVPRRNFLAVIPARALGNIADNLVEILDPEDAWLRWGQTNVYPFQVGGVSYTDTYGDLP